MLYGKLKHEGLGREADTAWGEAEYCIIPQDPIPSDLTSIQHEWLCLTDLEHTLVKDRRYRQLNLTRSALAAILVQ